MARIRTVKPELWSDVEFVDLSIEARLLYLHARSYANVREIISDADLSAIDPGGHSADLIAAGFMRPATMRAGKTGWRLRRMSGMKRQSLTPQKRRRIIDRDGMWCRLCGDLIVFESTIDIDHIVPAALGGGDEDDNLQVTHSWCNRSKGSSMGKTK